MIVFVNGSSIDTFTAFIFYNLSESGAEGVNGETVPQAMYRPSAIPRRIPWEGLAVWLAARSSDRPVLLMNIFSTVAFVGSSCQNNG